MGGGGRRAVNRGSQRMALAVVSCSAMESGDEGAVDGPVEGPVVEMRGAEGRELDCAVLIR